MKKNSIAFLTFILMLCALVGWWIYTKSTPSDISQNKILYWIDPMEPQVHYPGPGKSRMNMDLVPVYQESSPPSSSSTLKISPTIVDNLGVRTSLVTKGVMSPIIRGFGVVKPNEDKVAHIHTYVEGWIQKLYTKQTQEFVKKDQALFDIYSRELLLAQQEFILTSKTQGNAGLKYLDPNNSLKKLKALGVSEKQIEALRETKQVNPLVTIYAPQDGYIDSLNIREGMWVKPEVTVMSLTDQFHQWIITDIFPNQLPLIQVGQKAIITLPNSTSSNAGWEGKVDYIYPENAPVTLTSKVRITLDGQKETESPSLPPFNTNVSVEIWGAPKTVLQIPSEAVIWDKSGNRVVVALGNGTFEPRKIKTGMEMEQYIEVISGLKEGEKIVSSAQFMLDSEINMKSAMTRFGESSGETKKSKESPHAHHHHGSG